MLSLKETTKGVAGAAAAMALRWLETKKQPLRTPVMMQPETSEEQLPLTPQT